ncbi:MAG: AraC family transcriptional regulator ligand-binding domain-containing protein [Myxococcota bacterium]
MSPYTYALDVAWPSFLKQLGVSPVQLLHRAGLPEDLFHRPSPRLEAADYYRFWEALEAEAGGETLPLRLYELLRGEAFSPPLFAALCSPNLLSALKRLATYKRLVAPMRLDILETPETVTAQLFWLHTGPPPPVTLVVTELLFWVCLARMGTHEPIRPLRMMAQHPPAPIEAYAAFVGVPIQPGPGHEVVFSRRDAERAFLSSNDALWAVFEPELRRRLAELASVATTSERVRAVLLEGLPSGVFMMEDVARKLLMSRRTLQRRLEEEGTSFQELLRGLREELALHYLRQTPLPTAEISFLLGFEEPSSFFRAFSQWTGRTPELVRREAH